MSNIDDQAFDSNTLSFILKSSLQLIGEIENQKILETVKPVAMAPNGLTTTALLLSPKGPKSGNRDNRNNNTYKT